MAGWRRMQSRAVCNACTGIKSRLDASTHGGRADFDFDFEFVLVVLRVLQVLVSGLRVRVRLDEERLTQLLRGHGDAATTVGLLACLGDLATVSFDNHLSGAHHRRDIT